MKFLGCLGVIIFAIILLVWGAIRNIYYAAFGTPKRNRRRPQGQPQQNDDGTYARPNRRSGDNRIYPDNVGEYVNYEEVE